MVTVVFQGTQAKISANKQNALLASLHELIPENSYDNRMDAAVFTTFTRISKQGSGAVKRDGGAFDQFTGATITPRAVVNAIYQTLILFSKHKDHLFLAKQ